MIYICFALLNVQEVEMISFYGLNLGFGDKMIFTLEPLITDITLEEVCELPLFRVPRHFVIL